MRRLLIAAPVLLTGHAQAVDYLQCEAIERAYARTERERLELVDSVTAKASADISTVNQCGERPKVKNLFTFDVRDAGRDPELAAFLKCDESVKEPLLRKLSKKASEPYERKLLKIRSDAKKAGCQ
jgi:hypothetical protein